MSEARMPPGTIGMDWLFSESTEQDSPVAKPNEPAEIDYEILSMISTASGRKVFEWLWKHTILRSEACFIGDLGMDKGTAIGFARGGQNSLVMELHLRAERAKNFQKE